MDDMTQQNAALVEEAAAAAESLLQQAEQLDLQVNRFALKQQVSERHAAAAPVRRRAVPSLHLVSPAEDSWQSF